MPFNRFDIYNLVSLPFQFHWHISSVDWIELLGKKNQMKHDKCLPKNIFNQISVWLSFQSNIHVEMLSRLRLRSWHCSNPCHLFILLTSQLYETIISCGIARNCYGMRKYLWISKQLKMRSAFRCQFFPKWSIQSNFIIIHIFINKIIMK